MLLTSNLQRFLAGFFGAYLRDSFYKRILPSILVFLLPFSSKALDCWNLEVSSQVETGQVRKIRANPPSPDQPAKPLDSPLLVRHLSDLEGEHWKPGFAALLIRSILLQNQKNGLGRPFEVGIDPFRERISLIFELEGADSLNGFFENLAADMKRGQRDFVFSRTNPPNLWRQGLHNGTFEQLAFTALLVDAAVMYFQSPEISTAVVSGGLGLLTALSMSQIVKNREARFLSGKYFGNLENWSIEDQKGRLEIYTYVPKAFLVNILLNPDILTNNPFEASHPYFLVDDHFSVRPLPLRSRWKSELEKVHGPPGKYLNKITPHRGLQEQMNKDASAGIFLRRPEVLWMKVILEIVDPAFVTLGHPKEDTPRLLVKLQLGTDRSSEE